MQLVCFSIPSALPWYYTEINNSILCVLLFMELPVYVSHSFLPSTVTQIQKCQPGLPVVQALIMCLPHSSRVVRHQKPFATQKLSIFTLEKPHCDGLILLYKGINYLPRRIKCYLSPLMSLLKTKTINFTAS